MLLARMSRGFVSSIYNALVEATWRDSPTSSAPRVIAKTGRRQVPEPQRAVQQLRALAEPYRLRVVAAAEGFPVIPGRYGQIEWFDGHDLAVHTDRPRLFEKLWAISGMRRHQIGDAEMRAVFPPEALQQVAAVIRARQKRTQTSPRSLQNLRSRVTSRSQEPLFGDGTDDPVGGNGATPVNSTRIEILDSPTGPCRLRVADYDKRKEEIAMMGQLITVEDAAKLLSCSPAAVRKWLYQKRLRAVKIGRLTRLRLEDVEHVASAGFEADATRGAARSPTQGQVMARQKG